MRDEDEDEDEVMTISCPNPNCIRCQRYRQVQLNARSRFPWVQRQVAQEHPLASFDRIKDSIQQQHQQHQQHPHNHSKTNSLQAPTVLMVKDLKSQEDVTEQHGDTCRHFQLPPPPPPPSPRRPNSSSADGEAVEQIPIRVTILAQLETIPENWWTINDTPTTTTGGSSGSGSGSRSRSRSSWRVLSILNQGSWNQKVVQRCPQIYDFIRGLPDLLNDCLFGNAFISKIYSGTRIEPHCGPTNVRHRLQYALEIPSFSSSSSSSSLSSSSASLSNGKMTTTTTTTTTSKNSHQQQQQHQQQQLSLRVGRNSEFQWNAPGKIFVFDDSFVHSVDYLYQEEEEEKESSPSSSSDSNSNTGTRSYRMVLIVDLWHPDLTAAERKLIQYLYPPFFIGGGGGGGSGGGGRRQENDEQQQQQQQQSSKSNYKKML